MTVFCTIAGISVLYDGNGRYLWLSDMMIDGDGTGPSLGDPDWQGDTSLHLNGAALNATIDRFIVVPPQIIRGVPGIVLGCRARVTDFDTGFMTDAVAGDEGPADRIGEASIATATALGVPASPTTGGTVNRAILYELWPGTPALVEGKAYQLLAAS